MAESFLLFLLFFILLLHHSLLLNLPLFLLLLCLFSSLSCNFFSSCSSGFSSSFFLLLLFILLFYSPLLYTLNSSFPLFPNCTSHLISSFIFLSSSSSPLPPLVSQSPSLRPYLQKCFPLTMKSFSHHVVFFKFSFISSPLYFPSLSSM